MFILGYGVFADELIPSNTYLCPYTGAVMLEEEFDKEVEDGKREEKIGYIYSLTCNGKKYWWVGIYYKGYDFFEKYTFLLYLWNLISLN